MTKITLIIQIWEFMNWMSFMRLSFCFANDNRILAHSVYILKKQVTKLAMPNKNHSWQLLKHRYDKTNQIARTTI